MTGFGDLGLETNGLRAKITGFLAQRLDLALFTSGDPRAVLFVALAFVADQALEVLPEPGRCDSAGFYGRL